MAFEGQSEARVPGPLALVGSGEYLPQMAEVEAGLLAGRAPRYVQLATAAVPDGPEVVERWHRLGRQQAQRLGVEPVVLDVRTRADADDAQVAAQVAGAGLIYLSGGNPGFLADTLRDTAVWSAIVDAWRDGSALAGCSAGAMVMAAWVPSIRHPREGGTPGPRPPAPRARHPALRRLHLAHARLPDSVPRPARPARSRCSASTRTPPWSAVPRPGASWVDPRCGVSTARAARRYPRARPSRPRCAVVTS